MLAVSLPSGISTIDIGINEQDCTNITQHLKRLLAESYDFHWSLTGPQFRELHLLFEEQYARLVTAVDDIAERVYGELASNKKQRA